MSYSTGTLTFLGHIFLMVFIERVEPGDLSAKAGVKRRRGMEMLKGRKYRGKFVSAP